MKFDFGYVLVLIVQYFTILIMGILLLLCTCSILESTWWRGWSFDYESFIYFIYMFNFRINL